MRRDYTVGRPITSDEDAYEELQRVAVAFRGKINFRGLFDVASVGRMSPSPGELDAWIEQSSTSDTFYLQLSVQPRIRAFWTCTVESK